LASFHSVADVDHNMTENLLPKPDIR
jgi:hypothetical protein